MTTLEEFKDWWLSRPVASLQPIEFRDSGNRHSIVYYRDGVFAAEQILWSPNLVLPAHRHPHHDSWALPISGEMILLVGHDQAHTDNLIHRARTWSVQALKNRVIRINSDRWHGGKAGPAGCSFWSLQQWKKGVTQTAVGLDWEGPPLVTPEMKLCVCKAVAK